MAIGLDALLIAGAIFMIGKGAKRGLVLSLCSLLAVVVALVGARYAVHMFAPQVAERIAVSVEQNVTEQLQQVDFSTLGEREAIEQAIPEIIPGFGFYEKSADRLFALVQSAIDGTVENLIPIAAAETARLVANSLANAVVFVLAFVLVLLAFWVMSRLLNSVVQLPVLKQCNALGGAILGGVKALVLLFLIGILVRYAGVLVPQETVDQTHVLKFFVNLI